MGANMNVELELQQKSAVVWSRLSVSLFCRAFHVTGSMERRRHGKDDPEETTLFDRNQPRRISQGESFSIPGRQAQDYSTKS
jgi:hypothetical protein